MNKQIFASDFWQRLDSSSVLKMTFYDIPKAKIHSPMTPLKGFTSRVTVTVSFYGNGKHFSLVLPDIASTVSV